MTVLPANRAEPALGSASWRAAFGLTGWAVFFGAVVGAYLIAVHRHFPACEDAAAWGLSILLAAGVLAFVTALDRPGAGPDPGHRRPLAWPGPGLVLVCILLAAGSVAVIWVAMNLILAKEPIGAWILTVPGVAAAIAVPAGRIAWPGRPEPQAAGPAQAAVDQLGAHDGSQIALLPRETPETGHRPRLVNHGCLSELGNGLPTVALDAGFWRSALGALAGQETEQGGVALISRYQGALLIIGAVFPAQVGASSTHCEFSTADVDRVRQALDRVADDIGVGPGAGVHHLGAYSSPAPGVPVGDRSQHVPALARARSQLHSDRHRRQPGDTERADRRVRCGRTRDVAGRPSRRARHRQYDATAR